MKTTFNAIIMRLLGVMLFSFIVGSFVKTVESHEMKVFTDFISMSKDIVASEVPSTINSEVESIKVVPTYTVKPHIGLQMNMQNNIDGRYSYAVYGGNTVTHSLVGGDEDPLESSLDSS